MRKGRLGVFELRAKPDSSEMDSLNVNETGQNNPESAGLLAAGFSVADHGQRHAVLFGM